ncbi:MAG: hypothetical protein J0H68_08400 [Sphingobacteriia bacterium]|nr:hypothetical protein [Sphingobacteriia bacterium]
MPSAFCVAGSSSIIKALIQFSFYKLAGKPVSKNLLTIVYDQNHFSTQDLHNDDDLVKLTN